MPDKDKPLGEQDFFTYELIEEMRKRYLSEAADAERNGNFEEASLLNKLAQIEASTNAFLENEKRIKFKKPLGPTLKTKKRIKLLLDLQLQIKPTNQEHFAAELRSEKYQKLLKKHWRKKQLENSFTLLNFIKKYLVSNS
jgi:hypothetical protein